MEQSDRGIGRIPPPRLKIAMADTPAGMTCRHRPSDAWLAEVTQALKPALTRSPFRFDFSIEIADDQVLGLRFQRVGPSAGYALWKWKGIVVAATAMLNGTSIDDCEVLEHLQRGVPGLDAPAIFFNRLRESPRPIVGTAYVRAEPAIHPVMAVFIAVLCQELCNQLRLNPNGPPGQPLGTARRRDFPPRFLQISLTHDGRIRDRAWLMPQAFGKIADLQQVVMAFTTRLEESYAEFEEHLLLNLSTGKRLVRVKWQGTSPTAGMARLQDESQGVEQVLMLLSGRDVAADGKVTKDFESTLSAVADIKVFEAALQEFTNAPPPVLVCLTSMEPQKVDLPVRQVGQALGAAFFRRLGVF